VGCAVRPPAGDEPRGRGPRRGLAPTARKGYLSIMTTGEFCKRDVDTATYDEPVAVVARRMRDRQVGTIVVVDGERAVGIVTDRDLTVRVLATGLDAATTRVSEVMTPSPTTVQEDTPIPDALA
jgi:CBS domain-containing protein